MFPLLKLWSCYFEESYPFLLRELNSYNDIYLSVITIGEIRFGIEKLDHKHQSKKIEMLSNWLDNDLMQRFDGRIVDIDK
jgi:predicted nucleic acid-binding protein